MFFICGSVYMVGAHLDRCTSVSVTISLHCASLVECNMDIRYINFSAGMKTVRCKIADLSD